MLRLGGVALLLVFGCQLDNRPEPSREQATEAAPAPELASFASPWRPRVGAARFFSRPADAWDQHALELADFGLDVVVADGIATVTLDARVTNPTDEQAEAVIELPIPPGAAVTGAKLWVGDEPMAGVLLGSDKARAIYEQIVSRRRDPLLVAWRASDMLALSIFPLEVKQTRRFQVTWAEPAATDRQWVPSFYEQGEPIGAPARIAVNGSPARPDGDWVAIPRTIPAPGGDFRLRFQRETRPSRVAVLVDTSAAAHDRDTQWSTVEAFVAGMESQAEIVLIAADWLVRELATGRTLADFARAKDELWRIAPAGWLDQRQAVTKAQALVGSLGVVAVISSQPPASPTDAKLEAPVYWLDPNSYEAARDLVDRSGGRRVESGAELAQVVRPLVRPEEPGFEWLPLETATGHVAWLGSRQGATVASDAPATAVEALFYRAMLRRSQIPLDKIVSPRTSILVLESEEHYQRWGIKDQDGKLVRDRAARQTSIEGLLAAGGADDASSGSGPGGGGTAWATIGLGESGLGGTGAGYGIDGSRSSRSSRSSHSASVPTIRMGTGTVEGDLDQNRIRHYIRRALPRIRDCYERELTRYDELAGTATADFIITRDGRVAKVSVTLDHPKGARASACIEKALARIRFPAPRGGGIVKVRYPFQLAPGPATLWAKARTLLDGAAPGYEQRIGALFGADPPSARADLAWWLAEYHLRRWDTPPSGYAVVAELLRVDASGAQANVDAARRILSEATRRYPEVTAEIFRTWGLADDAERATHQWPHGAGYYGGLGTIGTIGR